MTALASLLRRFRNDDRGAFAVIFAVIAVVLIAFSGAVVDFVSLQQTRTRTQTALDAAALALQSRIFDVPVNPTDIKAKALALVVERIADPKITVTMDAPVISVTDGSLQLVARFTMPTVFVSLVGVQTMSSVQVAQATRKKLKLEVAFVLDNSNSMNTNSRMTNLIAATKCAANILLNDDCDSTATATTLPDTKLAIVPFTMQVNVGTNNANAAWMDRTGSNNISPNNFDDDDNDATPFYGPIDRIALFSKMTNASWGGCVEARKTPYDTDDTLPSPSQPYTMFTPMFAPDEPGPATAAGSTTGGFYNSYLADSPSPSCKQAPTCVYKETRNTCDKAGSNSSNFSGANCTGTTVKTVTMTSETGAVTTPAACPATAYNNDPTNADSYTYVGSAKPYTNTWTRTTTYNFSQRELQERLCKYNGTAMNTASQDYAHGPNTDCPVNAITPLTATKSTITAAINQLDPQGGTNIHSGTEWGFRVLSPTAPFTEGGAYDQFTSKVMIIMTDGENTAYQSGNMNNTSFYSAYGFPWNGRMGTGTSSNADLVKEMNARTLTTCKNAKAAGITVYTVGLAVDQSSDPTTNTKLLKDCSSGDGYWYFPAKSSDLTSVFTLIANQLSQLRLAL